MRSEFREFIEQVRDRSDVVDVIGADIELRQAGRTLTGLSPFHVEKTPSFIVWPETQTWRDYSGGGGPVGDVFAYVMQRERITFMEAVQHLADRAGLRRPNQDDAAWRRGVAMAVERREVERLLTIAATYWHGRTPTTIRDEMFKQHYGFADETVDRLQLGWADGQLFEYMKTAIGVSRDAALKTGLFVVLAGDRVVDFFQNRLVFPYWRGGSVVYFIARRTKETSDQPWETAKYKKLLTHSAEHSYVSPTVRNEFFYNEDAARTTGDVLVTEGVTDCIAAMQAGVPCISPVTTQFRKQDLPKLLELTRRTKRVTICNDVETNRSGEAGALATAEALFVAGRDVRIATLPRPAGVAKIDVNEFIKAHPTEKFRGIVDGAKRYVEYMIDSVPPDTHKADLQKLLVPILERVVRAPPLERDAYLDAIVNRFRIKMRTLNQMVRAATPEEPGEGNAVNGAAEPDEGGDGGPSTGDNAQGPSAEDASFERGDHAELAGELLKDLRAESTERLVFADGVLSRYSGSTGLWEPVNQDVQARMVISYAGRPADGKKLKVQATDVKGTLAVASHIAGNQRFFAEAPAGIAFTNGFVSWDGTNAVFKPHAAENRTRVSLPFAYRPNVRPRSFFAYLRQCFRADPDMGAKIRLICEFIGACLFGIAPRYARMLVFLGDGANGKSVFIKVVSSLFPNEARAAVPPQKFEHEYSKAQLAGVRINAVSELPADDILNSEAFKAIVAGDEITGRKIYQPPFRFTPVAGHLFAANKLPGTTDFSVGFWRRVLLVDWPRIFAEHEQDKTLADTLIDEELPGIAAWFVAGAVRLLRRGRYEIPKCCEASVDRWRKASDPVSDFVDEMTLPASAESPTAKAGAVLPLYRWTQAMVLFTAWEQWRTPRRYGEISIKAFVQRLVALGVKSEHCQQGTFYAIALVRSHATHFKCPACSAVCETDGRG